MGRLLELHDPRGYFRKMIQPIIKVATSAKTLKIFKIYLIFKVQLAFE